MSLGQWGVQIRALLQLVHEHWGASSILFRTLICSNHKTLCFIWFAGSSRLLISFLGRCLEIYLLFAIFDPEYSLISSNYSSMDMCIWFHSHLEKCTPLWRNSYYIGSLNFSSHFGNRCQWGWSLEGLREFGFYAFVAFALNVLDRKSVV